MAWSISLVNLDQLAFFRLKRLPKGQRVAVTGDRTEDVTRLSSI